MSTLLIPGVGLVDASGTLLIPGAGIVEQAAASSSVTLIGTGSALTLVGGTARTSLSLAGSGSALTLVGGTAASSLSLVGTGATLTLVGGTASTSISLVGTGGALTLVGGTATLIPAINYTLTGEGSALTLVGGEATFVFSTPDTEQPSGGYAAQNYAALDRQRRRRLKQLEEEEEEREALADRLEVQLAAEGLVEPDPAVAQRIVVREYAHHPDLLSRRAQRAVDYALRAKTELSWALAAREIARQEEDEELAVLLLLAAA